MFSGNNRISTRQIKYLLILEWAAKFCIFLPVCLSGRSFGSMIVCLFLGAAVWTLFIRLVTRWMEPGTDFFDGLVKTVGKPPAILCCIAGFLYFLVQASVFVNLCAELTAVYLLPEVSVPLLCLLPVAAGIYLAAGSVEVRGRFCEVAGPIVIGLMILQIFAAAFGMEYSGWESTLVSLEDELARGGYEVFACMGGMFLPFLSGHLVDNSRRTGNAVGKAGLFSLAAAGSLCTIAWLSYGKNGIQAIDFPAVRVMSNVNIPGGFLQRWDILFLTLVIVSMTVSVSGALWYIREILAVLWKESVRYIKGRKETGIMHQKADNLAAGRRKVPGTASRRWELVSGTLTESEIRQRVNFSWFFAAVLVYFAAAGFLNAFTAICYYRAMNMQILIPLLFFFYIIAGFRKETAGRTYRKIKWGKRLPGVLALAVLLIAVSFFVGGCTAREPEERLFPMALEIGIENGQLAVTYAWNEGQGPARTYSGTAEKEGRSGSDMESEEQEEDGREVKQGAQENSAGGTESGGQENSGTDMNYEKKGSQEEMNVPQAGEDIITLLGSSLEQIRMQETELTERYMDYSHVKAIVLNGNLSEEPELLRQVMEWLAGEPAFASGLIVYRGGSGGLSLQEAEARSSGQIGDYLENLYKNSEKYRNMSTTLGAAIAEYYA